MSLDNMTSLVAQSFKESHETFGWIEHEFTIVLNVLHVALYSYYMLYEILAYILTQIGYPSLPTLIYFGDSNSEWGYWLQVINFTLKMFGLMSAFFLAMGSASWRLIYIMIGCLTCFPYVGYDVYLVAKREFYSIDVNNFLLFQTLFLTTLRIIRILAFCTSCISIFHFILLIPPEAGIFDFL